MTIRNSICRSGPRAENRELRVAVSPSTYFVILDAHKSLSRRHATLLAHERATKLVRLMVKPTAAGNLAGALVRSCQPTPSEPCVTLSNQQLTNAYEALIPRALNGVDSTYLWTMITPSRTLHV